MKKLGYIIVIIILIVLALCSTTFTNSIQKPENGNGIVISVCTADMRALESGVSVYAAWENMPLILSDKTIPDEISNWLPGYIKDNNITKITVVGPMKLSEIIKLKMLGVDVKWVRGTSISSILTNLAQNYSGDTVVITDSDPLSAHLASQIHVPVFITAYNQTYQSSDYLDLNYINYLKSHKIKHVIIIGSLPETLIKQLDILQISYEVITASDSLNVSYHVNDYLKSKGYLQNATVAYYGFYGELASVIPHTFNENAMLIEDSSNKGGAYNYLKKNNITDVYLMRNLKTDYLMMEEEDYLTENINLPDLHLQSMTHNRTLDEATGLYDVRIISATNQTQTLNNTLTNPENSELPPLLEILEHDQLNDSNNITCKINKTNNTYTQTWSTIHPYTWTKTNNTYYATSNGEYSYNWTKNNKTWDVTYLHNNTPYHTTKWTKNNLKWMETQDNVTYEWYKQNNTWLCYKNNTLVYMISEI